MTSPNSGTGYDKSDCEKGGNGYMPISLQYNDYTATYASHPVWVRGLKQQHAARYDGLHNVAPRVGAWIETTELWTVCASIYEGRTPCGCVD